MAQTVAPSPGPAGWKILRFDTIDSTNSELRRRAAAGDAEGVAIIADHQTGGRGRLGRGFLSSAGKGLYLSAALTPDCPREVLPTLTAWAAVAVCDAIESLCGVRPGIKWPNDLVLGDKKLCGILTELVTQPDDTSLVILGIGVNLTQTPSDFGPEVAAIATSLSQALGRAPERDALAEAVLSALNALNRDFPHRPARWLACFRRDCLTLGREVRVLGPDGLREGTAADITADFGLLVRWRDDSESAVSSGEVSVRGLYGYV